MDAPQDETTRLAVLTALRHRVNDSALDIRWNPQSYITRPGQFDVYGNPTPPTLEGRWEVTRALPTGQVLLVWQVKEEITEAYRPLGDWLLDYMMTWDRANRFWMDEQAKLVDAAEARDRLEAAAGDAEQEEHIHRHAVDVLGMKEVRGVGVGQRARTLF